jgi:hypothetical protein
MSDPKGELVKAIVAIMIQAGIDAEEIQEEINSK